MKVFLYFCICTLIVSTVLTAQQRWSRLPSFTDISLGISWSAYNNNLPERINNVRPPAMSKSVIILSATIQSDESAEYSRWQPSVGLIGDFLWASADEEVNVSILTGGLFGNYDRGINFISEGEYRIGAGGSVEDFILPSDTYDQGYHMALGPNVKGEYLLSDSWYLRGALKYTFSFWHYVSDGVTDKRLKDASKHPNFFTMDVQAVSRWGWNFRMEYWLLVSHENSGLSVNRFWIHCTFPISRTTD